MKKRKPYNKPDFGKTDKAMSINLLQAQFLFFKHINKYLAKRKKALEVQANKTSSYCGNSLFPYINKINSTTSTQQTFNIKSLGQPSHISKTLKAKNTPDKFYNQTIELLERYVCDSINPIKHRKAIYENANQCHL